MRTTLSHHADSWSARLQVGCGILAAVLTVSLADAQQDAPPNRNTALRPAVGTQGMVCTAHPLATQVGVDILEAGGNAFDAAVAVSAAPPRSRWRKRKGRSITSFIRKETMSIVCVN